MKTKATPTTKTTTSTAPARQSWARRIGGGLLWYARWLWDSHHVMFGHHPVTDELRQLRLDHAVAEAKALRTTNERAIEEKIVLCLTAAYGWRSIYDLKVFCRQRDGVTHVRVRESIDFDAVEVSWQTLPSGQVIPYPVHEAVQSDERRQARQRH